MEYITPSGSGGGGIQRIAPYPNPSSNELTIDTNVDEGSNQTALVTLTNSDLKIVYSAEVNTREIRIAVDSFKPGTYYLAVTINGQTKQDRILIQN